MKKLMMLVCVLCVAMAANAATTFLGGNLFDAASWDGGLPAGQEATIEVDGYYGTNVNQINGWLNGSTATIGGGATLSLDADSAFYGAVLVTVDNATINCTDDFFVDGGDVVLNAGSVTTCTDDWEANNNAGRITVNGGTHSSGTGTGNNVGAQGSSSKIDCGVDFRGGTVTAGNFRFQVNSVSSVGGSAILASAGATTTFSDMSGAIDILTDWTGSWEVGSFGVGDWQAALTGGGNFTLDGAVIDAASFAANFVVSPDGTTLSYLNRTATSPDPANGETLVEIDLSARTVTGQLSWAAPGAYTGATYDVYFGTTEPNSLLTNYGLTKLTTAPQAATSIAPSLPLTNDQTYYWVVDSYEPNTVPLLHQGAAWNFTAAPSDYAPAVIAGSSYLTWIDHLPQTVDATVDDNGEGDIATVTWEIVSGPGFAIAEDMQMIDRAAQIGNIITGDPNLLRDWIGTDSRGANAANSDVLTLTLSGLPAGTYNWKSYHHDPENQADVFDVTVDDAVGSTTTIGVGQSSGTADPNTFTTTITSDGSDVTLAFVGSDDNLGMFTMNGFELTGIGDPLMIDFSRDNDPDTTENEATPIAVGYDGYLALHEVPETFTAQAFAAFGTTVTVTPSWDAPGATLMPGGTLLAPTATLDKTDAPKVTGTYTLQVTAADDAAQSGAATLEVKVAADACAAAKINGAAVNYYDVDGNCIVDLSDFLALAENWLNDITLTEAMAY